MTEPFKIRGTVTAALTPLDSHGKPDLARLQHHLQVLEADRSDAVLLLGTTGEGPSFNVQERQAILEAGILAAGKMVVIAQTGCASIADTLTLTRHAFDLGLKAVTVLPPFFFKDVSEDGLFLYYHQVLQDAVPPEGKLMFYHIPQITQVPISCDLVERLLETDGDKIAGIKDSAGDLRHLEEYCRCFPQLSVFTGNDHLILEALRVGASGCVTGVVNIFASMAAAIYQAHHTGDEEAENLQMRFTGIWQILKRYQPYTTLLKALCALRYQDSAWLRVRPPLDPMPPDRLAQMISELQEVELPESFDWIQKTRLAPV